MPWISADLRGSWRGLLRSRSVIALSVGSLALGLGTSTAMLGLLDVLLFRPPAHVRAADSLHRLYVSEVFPGSGNFTSGVLSYSYFRDFEATRSFAGVAAFSGRQVSLGRGSAAREARAIMVTPSLFPLLGVRPLRGRLFEAGEGLPGAPDFVVLVSAELAQRELGGPDAALGRRLPIGAADYTVVGVLPAHFTGVDLAPVDLWLPMNAAGTLFFKRWAENRGSKYLNVVARLAPGVSPRAAAEAATASFRAGSIADGRPQPQAKVVLGPLQEARGPNAQKSARIATWLTGLAGLVLLIACANVAALLLIRGLDRQTELALRLALGARPRRLVALALGEAGILALGGGLGGALLAPLFGTLVRRAVLPEGGASGAAWHPRTLGLLALLAALAALVAALIPALWTGRRERLGALRGGLREGGPGGARIQAGLAAAQLAFTFLLLTGAGAFGRSLANALHAPLGLDAGRTWVASAQLQASGYKPERVDEIFRRAEERARHLSGVERSALAVMIPFASGTAVSLEVPGVPEIPELPGGGPYVNAVSEGFFATTGTRIVRGRPFAASDGKGAPAVSIVNETMARALWPGGDPLSRCIRISGDEDAPTPCTTVVGVAEDAHSMSLREDVAMQWYLPLDQAPAMLSERALFVRQRGRSGRLAGALRREIQALDPRMPFVEVQRLEDLLQPELQPWRMGASVLALFSALALLLALAGLYAVIASGLARRRYELGVRAALGAERRHLHALALRRGLAIGLAGVAAGLVLARLAARRLDPLLYESSAFDPRVLAAAALLVLVAALLAAYVPARAASRLDVARVLRGE